MEGRRCELTSIEAEHRGRGIGTLLLDALVEVARRVGCTQVWLTTTNDNLDAFASTSDAGSASLRSDRA